MEDEYIDATYLATVPKLFLHRRASPTLHSMSSTSKDSGLDSLPSEILSYSGKKRCFSDGINSTLIESASAECKSLWTDVPNVDDSPIALINVHDVPRNNHYSGNNEEKSNIDTFSGPGATSDDPRKICQVKQAILTSFFSPQITSTSQSSFLNSSILSSTILCPSKRAKIEKGAKVESNPVKIIPASSTSSLRSNATENLKMPHDFRNADTKSINDCDKYPGQSSLLDGNHVMDNCTTSEVIKDDSHLRHSTTSTVSSSNTVSLQKSPGPILLWLQGRKIACSPLSRNQVNKKDVIQGDNNDDAKIKSQIVPSPERDEIGDRLTTAAFSAADASTHLEGAEGIVAAEAGSISHGDDDKTDLVNSQRGDLGNSLIQDYHDSSQNSSSNDTSRIGSNLNQSICLRNDKNSKNDRKGKNEEDDKSAQNAPNEHVMHVASDYRCPRKFCQAHPLTIPPLPRAFASALTCVPIASIACPATSTVAAATSSTGISKPRRKRRASTNYPTPKVSYSTFPTTTSSSPLTSSSPSTCLLPPPSALSGFSPSSSPTFLNHPSLFLAPATSVALVSPRTPKSIHEVERQLMSPTRSSRRSGGRPPWLLPYQGNPVLGILPTVAPQALSPAFDGVEKRTTAVPAPVLHDGEECTAAADSLGDGGGGRMEVKRRGNEDVFVRPVQQGISGNNGSEEWEGKKNRRSVGAGEESGNTCISQDLLPHGAPDHGYPLRVLQPTQLGSQPESLQHTVDDGLCPSFSSGVSSSAAIRVALSLSPRSSDSSQIGSQLSCSSSSACSSSSQVSFMGLAVVGQLPTSFLPSFIDHGSLVNGLSAHSNTHSNNHHFGDHNDGYNHSGDSSISNMKKRKNEENDYYQVSQKADGDKKNLMKASPTTVVKLLKNDDLDLHSKPITVKRAVTENEGKGEDIREGKNNNMSKSGDLGGKDFKENEKKDKGKEGWFSQEDGSTNVSPACNSQESAQSIGWSAGPSILHGNDDGALRQCVFSYRD